MSRKVVEIPVEVWEFSLQDAEHIAALHRETLRLMNENARLKAEVERLTSEVSYDNRVQLHVDKLAGEFTQAEFERLQAEVDRLRKAGDDVVADLEHLTKSSWFDKCKSVKRWNAAKEGKGQP